MLGTQYSVLTLVLLAAPADDLFESKVRPVLADHCLKCHGPAKQMGGVRLDGPDHLKAAADGSGPLVVPGKPGESRLVKAIRHEDGVEMPPKGKLTDAQIDAVARWVEAGAVWPAAVTKPPARDHWAFQPVKRPAVPAGDGHPVDRFVRARLAAAGLQPSGPADRRTFVRRVTFDLTGLPPTPAEVEAFVKEGDAEKLVDRLLATPAFGEKWGRHWLDVARYADSKRQVDAEESRAPFAYSFRDWVVGAFNRDLPYNEFVVRQLAADKVAPGDLAALGFLTVGRNFDGDVNDQIDDRLDTVGRGLLGLSVACARCHDHKYDPIPIKDYYSLYGVFAGTTEREVPLLKTDADRAAYLVWAKELWARKREHELARDAAVTSAFGPLRLQADRYLLAAHAERESEPPGERGDGLYQPQVNDWKERLEQTREEWHPVLGPWHALAAAEPDTFATLAAGFAANKSEDKPVNALVAAAFAGSPPKTLGEVAARYGRLFARIDARWQAALAAAAADESEPPGKLDDAAAEELRELLYDVTNRDTNEAADKLSGEARGRLDALRDRAAAWRSDPSAPPHAVVLTDPAEPETAQVFVRGNPETPGDEVPRQFLAVLAGPDRKPFAEGTGRLELARAVASADNPLTARVWVNRVWGHLFGTGLVATPSDFGTRSEPPSHPELLDWLAAEFVADGWSTKRLIRSLVLSDAYRQSSAPRPDARAVDPENRLLARMNRKRLEAEPLRDSLLAVAGKLDATAGGRPVSLEETPDTGRRSLYLRIDRGNVPGVLAAFDFANPDLHSPRRHETTVSQQALLLLNSPFAADAARGLAGRVTDTGDAWVRGVYRLALGRDPEADETAAARKFLKDAGKLKAVGPTRAAGPWRYGFGRWDGGVRDFTPLPHYQDDAWRGGPELPDAKLGWLMLTADGGHPGDDLNRVAVRRWVAPADGTVAVEGTLSHSMEEENAEADGVRGRVVRGAAVLAEAKAFKSSADTKATATVKAGDAIDFVVDCLGGSGYDTFAWPVRLHFAAAGKPERTFDSAEDFEGPPPEAKPLTPREKFAQVLLMANEFVYVD